MEHGERGATSGRVVMISLLKIEIKVLLFLLLQSFK
jgi:hypothetical protein